MSPAIPYDTDRDRDLLARCLARPADRRAWNDLYVLFAPFVRARIRFGRRAFPEHEVEDLVQTVFLKLAAGALDRFEGRGSLRGYLLRLADSVRISENRSHMTLKRGKGRVQSFDAMMENGRCPEALPSPAMPPHGADPEAQYLESSRAEQLRNAVNQLNDPRDREIVMLYFADEPRVDREIATLLGMPINTVTWRRLRALKELKRRLIAPEGSP